MSLLLDHTGAPMTPRAELADMPRRRARTTETAAVASGIGAVMAPYIGEMSPDPRLISRYRDASFDDLLIHQTYRATLADEQVSSSLNQRLDAAVAVSWEVNPGGPARRDRLAAEMLQEQLEQLDFDKICRQMLFGVYFGYAAAEAIWMYDGARVVLNDIRVRAPDRFRWSRDNHLLLRTWQNPLGDKITPNKFWVLRRPGEHGDTPHGVGLARWCYWPAWMRRNGHRFWAIALERFGSPIPKGTYPKGDLDSRDRMLEAFADLSAGAGIAMPEGQEIDLLYALKGNMSEQESFSSYMDKMISKVILGQSSTTEQGPWRGTAEVQKDVRDEVVASDCRLLDESFTRSIATWLTAWNFPGAATPRLTRDASPPEDLDARATREERVARMSGLRPTLKHVAEVYGGEWEAAPAPVHPQIMPGADPGTPPVSLAGPRPPDPVDAAVDALLADDGWEPYMDPVIQPILAAAAGGAGLEDLRNDLADIFEQMDADALVQTLRRMTFSSNLSGQIPDGN